MCIKVPTQFCLIQSQLSQESGRRVPPMRIGDPQVCISLASGGFVILIYSIQTEFWKMKY